MSSIKVFLAVLCMCLMAQIEFKIGPVPITGQSLGVLLVGYLLGGMLGGLAMILYLVLGAVGLPVFAGGSGGFDALIGKTGGFLFSFVPAAILCATLRNSLGEGILQILLNFTIVTVLILLLGGIWLALSIGWKTSFVHVLPDLLPGAAIKIVMAVLTVKILTMFSANS